jgi:hypothetical protein
VGIPTAIATAIADPVSDTLLSALSVLENGQENDLSLSVQEPPQHLPLACIPEPDDMAIHRKAQNGDADSASQAGGRRVSPPAATVAARSRAAAVKRTRSTQALPGVASAASFASASSTADLQPSRPSTSHGWREHAKTEYGFFVNPAGSGRRTAGSQRTSSDVAHLQAVLPRPLQYDALGPAVRSPKPVAADFGRSCSMRTSAAADPLGGSSRCGSSFLVVDALGEEGSWG